MKLRITTGTVLGLLAFGTLGGAVPFFGDPLPGLTPAEQARFADGKDEFTHVETVADGLGPTFNDDSCASCHSDPAAGGAGTKSVTRFGRIWNGKFDPMAELGGSLIQAKGIGPVGSCDYTGETVPPEATIVAERITTPLWGLGLVDAVPDQVFREIAMSQSHLSPRTAGRAATVDDLVHGGKAVGKFGWKCQNPSLLQFAADAYLNEMGITNPLFPHESCPNGNCGALACDPVPDVEDLDGHVKLADFMTFLAPPPRGPVTDAVRNGEREFQQAGCASCHLPQLQTGPSKTRALDRVTFHPYSDFLLHDMGALGDGIEQGDAKGRDIRTAPLWGVSHRSLLLHDGRATTLEEAIRAHDGQGRGARDRYAALPKPRKDALLAFVGSL